MHNQSLAGQLILQLILILVNAFFAATEIAFISINDNKLKKQADSGDKKAERILAILKKPTGFLSTIQIGITLAGFLGSAFAADNFSERLVELLRNGWGLTSVSLSMLKTVSVIVITLILSYFTLVLGELFPKRIAMKKAEGLARAASGIISFLSKVLRPLVWITTVSTNGLLRLVGINPKSEDEAVSEEDIRLLLDVGEESGTIDRDEKELLENVFELGDAVAEDIMVHRTAVTFIYLDDTHDDILRKIEDSRYSRFPVCGEGLDDVVGTLRSVEYLTESLKGKPELSALLQETVFVPAGMKAAILLKELQSKHRHLAVVVDEFGGTLGIITLEDILEELVGEIWDESDEVTEDVINNPDGSYSINGAADIEDFFALFGIKAGTEAATVGGWLVDTLGKIPDTDERFVLDGLEIRIAEADGKKISKILVKRQQND
jgi:putative hemolysin